MKHPTARPLAASRVVANLYLEHVELHGDVLRLQVRADGTCVTSDHRCGCNPTAPDQRCDPGEALFRLQAKELLPFSDGRKGR